MENKCESIATMGDSIAGNCNYEGSKRGIQFDLVTHFRTFFSHGWLATIPGIL